MKSLLFVIGVLGITEFVLSTEPVSVNFVIFEDSEPGTVFDLIQTKVRLCLNSKEVKIGQIHRIKVSNESKPETVKHAWTNATKNVNPDFVFDFTNGYFASLTTISVLQNESIPVVVTGVNKKLAMNKISSEQKTKTNQWTNHFLEMSSPEGVMKNRVMSALMRLNLGTSGYFVNEYCVRSAIPQYSDRFFDGYQWKEGTLPQKSIDQIFLIKKITPYILLFGSGAEISRRLETAVKMNKNLITRAYSWWVIPNDIDGKVKLPKGLKQLMVFTPESKNFTESVAKFGTKNMTELFYFDVICQTIAAVGFVKSKDPKIIPVSVIALRSKLKQKLETTNLLGNYVYSDKFNEWYLDFSWKIELVTVNSTKSVATVTLPNNYAPQFNITNLIARSSHLPISPLEATVVVDPPFIMRNETCFAKKENLDAFPGCYFGYVIDLFQKFVEDTNFLVLLTAEERYGEYVKRRNYEVTGARRSVEDLLVALGIGAFSTKKTGYFKKLQYSTPFYVDSKRNDSYAFPLSLANVGNRLKLNNTIAKLKNEGYLDQFYKKWFVEYKCKNCTASNH